MSRCGGRCDHEHRVSATGVVAASVTIAPVMAPILALYPIPNLPNNQYTFPSDSPSQVDWGQIRVDENISVSDTLFGRYTTDKSYLFQRVRTLIMVLLLASDSRNLRIAYWSYDQFATISENHIFSPTVLNQFRFSYSRTNFIWR